MVVRETRGACKKQKSCLWDFVLHCDLTERMKEPLEVGGVRELLVEKEKLSLA